MDINQFRKRLMQELLAKHAKFFAADKKATNKVFQGIGYQADGSACVCDTIILLRIKDVSPFSEPHTLHAITGAEIEGTYPNEQAVDNLLYWTSENQITLETFAQVEAATQCAKVMRMVVKELKTADKIVNLVLLREKAFLQLSDQGVELKVSIGELVKDQDETWSFNADYLYYALDVFKSAGSTRVVIKLRHRNDSIVYSDEENGIDVLILPVRTNAEVRDGCS